MIELSSNELNCIHKYELEMLIEVDRICRKHLINYTIIGGTLLGAARDGGFIPWDDDADVAMLRPEYDRFCKICYEELDNERFYFQNIDITPGYRWGYAKIRRKGTLFLRENQEHMPYDQGVFLDVFPQDAVPDSPLHRRIHSLRCFCVRKMLWSEIGKGCERNWIKKSIYKIINRIPLETMRKWYHSLIITDDNSQFVRTLTFPPPKGKHGYRRTWIKNTAEIEFEGIRFLGVKDYEGWLRWEFGDYMVLPPENKRKAHPVTELRL